MQKPARSSKNVKVTAAPYRRGGGPARPRTPRASQEKPSLRVGTDCSGIETPLMALQGLGVPFQHVFSSDIDAKSKVFVERNFPSGHFYDDLKDRDNALWTAKKGQSLDLYVAGFPCQTFSTLGNNKGFDDDKKGNVFFYVYDFIRHNRPTVFVLENVKNLRSHDQGRTYQIIRDHLTRGLNHEYDIHDDILSTVDYGIPQSRKRIYFVGIKKSHLKRPFSFPTPPGCQRRITDFLDPRAPAVPLSGREPRNLRDAVEKYQLNLKDPWILNLDFSRIDWFSIGQPGLCPCLVTRCDYYITFLNRKLTPQEALNFQGIDHRRYDWNDHQGQPLPDRQLYKFAGNCMSVNVLQHLFTQIFKVVDFRTPKASQSGSG